MAVTSSSTSPLKPISSNPDSTKRNSSSPIRCSSSSKRVKCVKDQVLDEGIIDLEIKTSCHQCRQKTTSLVATCRNQRNKKTCNISFCRKCLFNRYGEKAEEVGLLSDWKCPICKCNCNCSVCMKKKGKQPTGMLVHAAKATGFSSVSDMLNGKETESCSTTSVKDINSLPQNTDSSKTVVASPSKHGKKIYVGKSGSSLHEKTHMEEHVAASPMKTGKENIFAGKSGSILQVNSLIAKNAAECRQKNMENFYSNVKACQGKEKSEVENTIAKKSKVLKERKLNSNINEEMTVEKDGDGVRPVIKGLKKSFNAKESSRSYIKVEKKKIRMPKETNSLMTIFKDVSQKCIKKDVKVIELDECSDDEKKMPESDVIVPEIKVCEKVSVAADFQMQDSEEISEGGIDKVDVVDGRISRFADEKRLPNRVTDDDKQSSFNLSPPICELENSMETHDTSPDAGISRPQGIDVSPTIRELKKSMKIHDASIDAGNSRPQGIDVSPTIRELKKSMKINVASIDADASLAQGIDVSPAICGLKNLMKIHDAGLDTGISSPQGIDVSPTIHAFKNSLKTHDAGISLPQGTDVTSVAGIDIPAEDVGHALQFLEFCKAFGQFFHLSKSHPESILRELSRGCGRRCRTQYSSVVQFQIQLLSLLLKDTKQGSLSLNPTSSENSWLQALEKCISESKFTFDGLPSNCFNKDGIGYAMLDFSQKLRLLNFLCDEALCTRDLRAFIDEQNSIVIEKEKEARQMVLAAKEKEKHTKQQMQNEIEKAIATGKPLSITEHDELVSKMKKEAEDAHTEMLQAMEKIPKTKQRSDAVRTDSILFDGKGHVFWRLKSHSKNTSSILVQDIESLDTLPANDRWFTYDDVEEKGMVDRYISSRGKRVKLQKYPNLVMSETYQA